jgi:hypothetical protein
MRRTNALADCRCNGIAPVIMRSAGTSMRLRGVVIAVV